MAKMLSPALGILLLAIVLLNFASTSMPQRTLSDHHLPLSRFQLATRLQPIVASRSSGSSKLPAKPSSTPFAESQQLSSESDKEKKEEEKERKKEEKEREKERKKEEKERKEEEKEREKEKKKKKKDCSWATTIKQSNMGVLFIVSLELFFFV